MTWVVRRLVEYDARPRWRHQFIIELGDPTSSDPDRHSASWGNWIRQQTEPPLLFVAIEDAAAAALVHGGEVVSWPIRTK